MYILLLRHLGSAGFGLDSKATCQKWTRQLCLPSGPPLYTWRTVTFFCVAFLLWRLCQLGNRFQHWSKAHARKVVDNYSVDSKLDAFAGKSQGYDGHILCQVLPRQRHVYSVIIKHLPCISAGIYSQVHRAFLEWKLHKRMLLYADSTHSCLVHFWQVAFKSKPTPALPRCVSNMINLLYSQRRSHLGNFWSTILIRGFSWYTPLVHYAWVNCHPCMGISHSEVLVNVIIPNLYY